MSSPRIPSIRVSAPKGSHKQNPPRFTWHTSKVEKSQVFPPKSSLPQRFFGSNSHLWFSERRDFLKEEMVPWENTFSMRANNLNQFSANTSYRSPYRSQAVALQRCRTGFITGTVKSLDILRQNLQKDINKEIDEVIQKYLKKFFKLAIENIKKNNGEQAVTDQHVQTVCRQILEEAKKMYQTNSTPNNSSISVNAEVEPPPPDIKPARTTSKCIGKKRSKDSDNDSEKSYGPPRQKKKKGRPPIHYPMTSHSGRGTPLKVKLENIKREGPKWEPDRLNTEALFIMGAKANKVLGLGATRGRLYIKHPDVFKYSGDQEDKQWLYDHNLMPATGGKAYMLLVEDIQELAETEEYRNSPALMINEIVGFTVPETMLEKMRTTMIHIRDNAPMKKRGRPAMNNIESSAKVDNIHSTEKLENSRAGTPSDDMFLLGSDLTAADRSPFSLSTGFDDISPARVDVSPAPSDISTTLEPPLTASFEVTSTP